MSRIGKRPIKIEEGVEVVASGSTINLKSTRGELTLVLTDGLDIKITDGVAQIARADDSKVLRAQHGLHARLLANMITDLKDGFVKILDFKGTGYRVRVENNTVILNMGYSHEIVLKIPEGISVNVVKNTINVEGIKRDAVGQFAAMIRDVRGPEPYKGKGIKYRDEVIKRKAGKAAQSGGKA